MPWQDRQKQGTFRGIPFQLTSNELSIGRRTVVYEIPGSERGVGHVDNGRRGWRETLEIVVVGLDYDLTRDDLIAAFETPGPAILVHPYHGRRNVVIDGPVSIVESSARGGSATISFTAVEVPNAPTPEQVSNTRGALKAASAAASAAFAASFENGHKTSGFENFVRDNAVSAIQDGLAQMRKITGKIDSQIDSVNQVSAGIDDLTAETAQLIQAPGNMIDAVVGISVSLADSINTLKSVAGNESRSARRGSFGGFNDAVGRVKDLDSSAASLDNADTPARRQEAINARLWNHSLKGVMFASLAGAIADSEFEFAEDARDLIDTFTDGVDDLIEDMSTAGTTLETTIQDLNASEDATSFQRLRDLQAALYDYLDEQAGRAKNLVSYTPAESLPSVVIAYQLYGDSSRHEEIENRNTDVIRNPNFVPGSIEIEVISE